MYQTLVSQGKSTMFRKSWLFLALSHVNKAAILDKCCESIQALKRCMDSFFSAFGGYVSLPNSWFPGCRFKGGWSVVVIIIHQYQSYININNQPPHDETHHGPHSRPTSISFYQSGLQVLRFLQHDLGLHSWQHGGSWEAENHNVHWGWRRARCNVFWRLNSLTLSKANGAAIWTSEGWNDDFPFWGKASLVSAL